MIKPHTILIALVFHERILEEHQRFPNKFCEMGVNLNVTNLISATYLHVCTSIPLEYTHLVLTCIDVKMTGPIPFRQIYQ